MIRRPYDILSTIVNGGLMVHYYYLYDIPSWLVGNTPSRFKTFQQWNSANPSSEGTVYMWQEHNIAHKALEVKIVLNHCHLSCLAYYDY